MKIEHVMITAIVGKLIITLALFHIVFNLGYSPWWLLLIFVTGYSVKSNKE